MTGAVHAATTSRTGDPFLLFAPDQAESNDGFQVASFELLARLEPTSFWFRSRAPTAAACSRRFRRRRCSAASRSDSFLTAAPSVLFEGGTWRMWYVSGPDWDANPEREPNYNIRYANPATGSSGGRQGTSRIDFSYPGEHAIARPHVMKDGSAYRMWYSHRGQSYRIGFAESADRLEWTRKDEEIGITVSSEGWDSEMVAYPWVGDLAGRRRMRCCGQPTSQQLLPGGRPASAVQVKFWTITNDKTHLSAHPSDGKFIRGVAGNPVVITYYRMAGGAALKLDSPCSQTLQYCPGAVLVNTATATSTDHLLAKPVGGTVLYDVDTGAYWTVVTVGGIDSLQAAIPPQPTATGVNQSTIRRFPY
jgi:hypothetical protein